MTGSSGGGGGREGKRPRLSPSAPPSDDADAEAEAAEAQPADAGTDAEPQQQRRRLRPGASVAAGGNSASATPAPPGFAEEDWFLPQDPPFKLPSREARAAAAAAAAVGGGKRKHAAAAAPLEAGPRHPPPPKRWQRLRQLLQSENYGDLPASAPTYSNIAAPPSTYPPKRYCDLTGLEAPYTDPKTGLRYASAQLFGYLRALPPDAVQARLALRRAEIVLR